MGKKEILLVLVGVAVGYALAPKLAGVPLVNKIPQV